MLKDGRKKFTYVSHSSPTNIPGDGQPFMNTVTSHLPFAMRVFDGSQHNDFLNGAEGVDWRCSGVTIEDERLTGVMVSLLLPHLPMLIHLFFLCRKTLRIRGQLTRSTSLPSTSFDFFLVLMRYFFFFGKLILFSPFVIFGQTWVERDTTRILRYERDNQTKLSELVYHSLQTYCTPMTRSVVVVQEITASPARGFLSTSLSPVRRLSKETLANPSFLNDTNLGHSFARTVSNPSVGSRRSPGRPCGLCISTNPRCSTKGKRLTKAGRSSNVSSWRIVWM